jgi:hypothetical protein
MNLYRSLGIERPPDESLFKILERLAGEGYLQNNRHLDLKFDCSRSSRFVELICSMKNLESLDVNEHDLAPDVLAYVFKSCSKLIEMDIAIQEYKMYEMAEHLKIQLRSGFQKLRRLDLIFSIDDDTLPVIQEMLT